MPDPTGRISHVPEMHRGEAWKQPCRVATTANITIATALNAGDTIDGVTLAAGDRVLVKDQSTGSQNGIYVVSASPARAFDMDQDGTTSVPAEEVIGAFVYVYAGTVNGGTLWRATNTSAPTLGTTTLTFTQFWAGSGPMTIVQHGSMGATETFTFAITPTPVGSPTSGPYHAGTLDANLTVTLAGAVSGEAADMVLILTQDATGGRTITWPASVEWPDGITPTLSTDANSVEVISLLSKDGGTVWLGFHITATGGSALTIEDEGTPLATAATTLNFVGAGVTATGTGTEKTITISGGSAVPPAILLESGHATPFTFDDILQESDGSDFLWASE